MKRRKVKLFDLMVDAFERKDPVAFELRERLLRGGIGAEAEVIEIEDKEDNKAKKLEEIKRRARAHDQGRTAK